jgi:hypothetical protein
MNDETVAPPESGSRSRFVGADPSVHIEDQGAPDQYNRVTALVRIEGAVVGEIQYGAWPSHLVIFSASWEDDAPKNAESRLMQTLLTLYPEQRPPRMTHSAIVSMETLRWYAQSHLATGLIGSGSFGSRTLFYDAFDIIDVSEDPEPLMEGMPATTLTLMYVDQLRELGEMKDPTVERVRHWVVDGDPLTRFVAIRRMATDPHVDPELKKAALELALLSENGGVRQFAAVHLGGFFPELEIRTDPEVLHEILLDPMSIWRRYGVGDHPGIEGYNAAQTRRNVRYAIAWTLGNMCWNAMAWGSQDWAMESAARIRALMEAGEAGFSASRDAWLYGRALDDFSEEGDRRYAIGVDEPINLFEFCRYAWLRHNIVVAKGLEATDRFYWLSTMADGIVGRAHVGDPQVDSPFFSPAAHRLYADAPGGELPDAEEMPVWMHGRNPNMAGMGVG